MIKLQRIALVALSFLLPLALLFASSSALHRTVNTTAMVVGTPVSLGEIVVEADRNVENASTNALNKDDVLWLARVIYSETKKPHEQELVAWVVRNRVETEYRGNDSYKEVVLDPWQFSAFNRNSPKRGHYTNLNWSSKAPGFQKALEIAEEVAAADTSVRPFSNETRHFYSEQSMVGRRAPAWASGKRPVKLDRPVEARRFRFYEKVS